MINNYINIFSLYKFFIVFIVLFNISQAKYIYVDKKLYKNDDLNILLALDYERNNDYNNSIDIFIQLFEKSNRYIYIKRSLEILLKLNDDEAIVFFIEKYMKYIIQKEGYQKIMGIYIYSLLKIKKYNKALKYAIKLLSKYNNELNYKIVADVYYGKKDYNQVARYLESAYLYKYDNKVLINLVNILYSYLNKKSKAILYLKAHIQINKNDLLINYKLLDIYKQEKNMDKIIFILNRIYLIHKNSKNMELMYRTYQALISYLEQKDVFLAIKFLEKDNIDFHRLLILYRQTNQINKQLNLIKDMYKKSSNIDFLAKIALIEFETIKNKKIVLNSVISKLERVLTVLDNDIYQNFLGYILIDYDINIKKGILYIQSALKKSPNNLAYLDSLAWGKYKLSKCKEAYEIMKKIVDKIGLKNRDIKLHWNKIKECKNDFR